jgi:hypothetical protein
LQDIPASAPFTDETYFLSLHWRVTSSTLAAGNYVW